MGLLRRSKRADRPATPSGGGSSNAGLFSRIFGRKPTQSSHTARETARKRRSVRMEAHSSAPTPSFAPSPPAPSPVSRSFSVKHKSSTTSSGSGDRLGGGLLGFVKKKSNMSLRASMQPKSANRASASPLYDQMASRPTELTPVAASFLNPTSQARRGSTQSVSTSISEAVIDVPPPVPPKTVSKSTSEDDLVRATSPPPRAALETLEMAAPLSALGARPGAALVRGRSISGPGRSVTSAVTTVTTNEDSQTVISPAVEAPGTPTTIHSEVQSLQPTPELETPADIVIPSPMDTKIEFMPVTPEAKAASGVSTEGIASASAVGAVAAAAFAAEAEEETVLAPALVPSEDKVTPEPIEASKPQALTIEPPSPVPNASSPFQTPLSSVPPAIPLELADSNDKEVSSDSALPEDTSPEETAISPVPEANVPDELPAVETELTPEVAFKPIATPTLPAIDVGATLSPTALASNLASPVDEPIVSPAFKAATSLPPKATLALPDTPLRSPASSPATPQRAMLTPRRDTSSSTLSGTSPRTPNSFKSSPRSPATPVSPGTPGSAASDATLDDFMGLFKTVITRDKGTSIRDAARRAEHRPVV